MTAARVIAGASLAVFGATLTMCSAFSGTNADSSSTDAGSDSTDVPVDSGVIVADGLAASDADPGFPDAAVGEAGVDGSSANGACTAHGSALACVDFQGNHLNAYAKGVPKAGFFAVTASGGTPAVVSNRLVATVTSSTDSVYLSDLTPFNNLSDWTVDAVVIVQAGGNDVANVLIATIVVEDDQYLISYGNSTLTLSGVNGDTGVIPLQTASSATELVIQCSNNGVLSMMVNGTPVTITDTGYCADGLQTIKVGASALKLNIGSGPIAVDVDHVVVTAP